MTKTSNGVVSKFAYDTTGSTPEVLTDGVNNYVYGLGGAPVAQTSLAGGVTSFLEQDVHGSTRLVTSTANAVVGDVYLRSIR